MNCLYLCSLACSCEIYSWSFGPLDEKSKSASDIGRIKAKILPYTKSYSLCIHLEIYVNEGIAVFSYSSHFICTFTLPDVTHFLFGWKGFNLSLIVYLSLSWRLLSTQKQFFNILLGFRHFHLNWHNSACRSTPTFNFVYSHTQPNF